MSNSKIDVQALSSSFNKPVKYVEACLKFHGISSLPKFRTPDDGYGDFYSDMSAHFSDEPSRTKQEFADECDINNIMARFRASGYDPSSLPLTSRKAFYGDITNMPESYHAALNYVKDTERAFMELPAEFRAKFDNDPQGFLNYVQDPKNHDELVELGYILPSQPSASDRQESGGQKDELGEGGSIPPAAKSSSKAPKNASAGHDGGPGD